MRYMRHWNTILSKILHDKKSFNYFFALHWSRTETMEKELLDMMDEEIDEEKIDELNTSSTSTA